MAYSKKWNQPAAGGKKTKGRGASGGGGLKVALGLVLCAAVLGGAWWWLSRRAPAPERPAPEKPSIAQKSKPRDKSKTKTKTTVQTRQEQVEEQPQIQVKRYGHSSNVPTSNTNNIHYASQTGLKVVDADGNEHEVRPKPIFKSRADNMLWAAVRPGGMPSGLNALRSRMRFQTGSDEAFLQALRNQDITIDPDDPPHVVNAKKVTIEVKQGIIAELDKGRTFDDIYQEISAETRKERMYERIAHEDMRKITRERDAAAMRKYVEDMNPVMREMGLKELRLPSWASEGEVEDKVGN